MVASTKSKPAKLSREDRNYVRNHEQAIKLLADDQLKQNSSLTLVEATYIAIRRHQRMDTRDLLDAVLQIQQDLMYIRGGIR